MHKKKWNLLTLSSSWINGILEKDPFLPTKTWPRDYPHPCVMALMDFLLCRNKALQVRKCPPKALRCKGMSPADSLAVQIAWGLS